MECECEHLATKCQQNIKVACATDTSGSRSSSPSIHLPETSQDGQI